MISVISDKYTSIIFLILHIKIFKLNLITSYIQFEIFNLQNEKYNTSIQMVLMQGFLPDMVCACL